MKRSVVLIVMGLWAVCLQAHPVKEMLDRIDRDASDKFILELSDDGRDFFELDSKEDKVVIRADNYVNMAAGVNWYLKYYAGIHLSWNCMTAELPDTLPAVPEKERRHTDLPRRYYLNYCTYSYSMAFWDWDRWQQEIDWMALHGINMPLAATGMECVWMNVLQRLGYSRQEILDFIAGPAFNAWWLMNNLEGWGGPVTDTWMENRCGLQQKIVAKMKEYGMDPVFPGYSGMLPHDAGERLGLDVSDTGYWNGYPRPAILSPDSPDFSRIASVYYEELEKLYGKAPFYSMDPFHEGGSVGNTDLPAVGKAIMAAMKRANPDAVWVAQAWDDCPYDGMIAPIPEGDMIILDLDSDNRPQCWDPSAPSCRENGFGRHGWMYCMLMNYGGAVGLHGKMDCVISGFYRAKESPSASTLKGTGLTMEGIGNNPVMYELFSELPWRQDKFTKEDWIEGYAKVRYGRTDSNVTQAWRILANSVYNGPRLSGVYESVFCARPTLDVRRVSTWADIKDYYDPEDIFEAAGKMAASAERFRGNDNFEYDLVDIVRQAVTEKGRQIYREIQKAYESGDAARLRKASNRFLELILLQDRLLSSRPEFMLGSWIESAVSLGTTPEEKDWLEWNARVQITTWGNRTAAEDGGLRDYAHKEWSGLLRDFYYPRWKVWLEALVESIETGKPVKEIDFYAMDEAWTLRRDKYPSRPQEYPTDIATEVLDRLFFTLNDKNS